MNLEGFFASSHQFRGLRVRTRHLLNNTLAASIIKQHTCHHINIYDYLVTSISSKLLNFLQKNSRKQTSFKMSSQTSSAHKQYYLITNVQSSSSSTTSKDEIDLHSESWKLPYSIDDEDLMFDGKPLNMLYEENRYYETRDRGEKKSRGRSRKK